MALETVTVNVLSDDLPAEDVDSVVVRVFSEDGATLITSGSTGDSAEGEVEFTLSGDVAGTVYQLRFYISGGSIPSPQYISVFSPPVGSPTGTNRFEIEAHLFTLPDATDLRLCRCSGRVVSADGRALLGVNMYFVQLASPLIAHPDLVLGERIHVRTDANGEVTIDLFRHGLYQAIVQGHENVPRDVEVPDRASVNIAHLLFPRVASIEYDPAGPFTVEVGEQLEVMPTVITSAFVELFEVAEKDVLYATDDEAIATVNVLSDRIVITGVSPGSTNLRVTRIDSTLVYSPDTDIVGGVVSITVTA